MIQKTFFPLLFLFFFTPLFAQNPFIQSQPEKKENSKIISIQQPSSENWFLKKIIGLQNQLNEKMASGLEELKNTNNKALFFMLCFLAFLYGIIHALGPGHGKTILINWILSSSQKKKTILLTSVFSVMLHAFSSIFIIGVTYLVLNQFFSMDSEKIQNFLKIPSGIILILVGIYFIIHVILEMRKKKEQKENQIVKKEIHSFWVIFSIGIVPCPISTLIMVFSLSQGLFFYGIIFVLFFAIGMGMSLLTLGLMTYVFREKLLFPKFKKIEVFFYFILPILAGFVFILSGIGMFY